MEYKVSFPLAILETMTHPSVADSRTGHAQCAKGYGRDIPQKAAFQVKRASSLYHSPLHPSYRWSSRCNCIGRHRYENFLSVYCPYGHVRMVIISQWQVTVFGSLVITTLYHVLTAYLAMQALLCAAFQVSLASFPSTARCRRCMTLCGKYLPNLQSDSVVTAYQGYPV